MNILVFHHLEDVGNTRGTISDYLFCFERYAGQHHYVYHRITFPITEALRTFPFDAIIFDSTSLGVVTFRPRSVFYDLKDRLSFLADSGAVKLAFPQDDYHHSDVLDQWLFDLRCDAVFTPLIDSRCLFYPKLSQRADFFSVLTGYVDDERIEACGQLAKPFHERNRSIAQRVTFYPPWGGRFSRIKGETAEMVKHAAAARGLTGVDISTASRDVLNGDAWFRLLGDAKFCLGAESGVSLWDRDGQIYDRTEAYTASHPDAGFDEVEAACFPGLDRQHIFSAVSPRLFEAAMMRCCQILVAGSYLPELKPYDHYIPLAADGSNLDEVFALMRDDAAAERRAGATYDALIANPEYRYSRLVAQVMGYLTRKAGEQSPRPAATDFDDFRRTHRRQLLAALSEREHAAGFDGEELVSRVASLFAGQAAEAHSQAGGGSRLIADLARDLLALLDRNRALDAEHAQMAARLRQAVECPDLADEQRETIRQACLAGQRHRSGAVLPWRAKTAVALMSLAGRILQVHRL